MGMGSVTSLFGLSSGQMPDDIKVSLLILASFLLKPIAYDPQTNSANQCDDACTSLLGHVLFW